jgi:dTDP-4-amino-4,6-dideoxygalactose transaminase
MARWPVYDEAQIEAVTNVLRSGEVNAWTGPHVANFEHAYAAYLGVRHAVAVANGTLALDLALFALDLCPGDEVIVSPRSFIASASCVPFAGGIPVFADVDRDSQNITVDSIRSKLTPRTKGIIAVHLAGWPCDMPAIMALARERDLWVIEDCAQAHGAEIDGRPIGSFGDISAFSFCQDKIITTGGEGGLIAMNDDNLWSKAWSRKDHGKSYDTVFNIKHPPGFRWLHESIGTNWRMTSIQAVLGLVQLDRLAAWHDLRARNAAILANTANDLSALRTPAPGPGVGHAHYRFYTFMRPERLRSGWSRDRVIAEITAAGVPCFSGSCSEIYLEKAFTTNGMGPLKPLPVAHELGETSLAFLVDPAQDIATIQNTAAILREVVISATLESELEMTS